MKDHKKTTKAAVDYFLQKNYDQAQKAKRKNEKPEKEVERAVMLWLNTNGFDCNVVESKAVYNPKIQRFLHSQAAPGMSDIVGNTDAGRAVFIELKAPGRRVASAVSDVQRFFLMRKIQSHCFALVVDSVEYLERTYNQWLALPLDQRVDFLFKELPQPKDPPKSSKVGGSDDLPF